MLACELREVIFNAGEEIPYVDWLSQPTVKLAKYRDEHPTIYNVGEAFPEGVEGELLVPEPENALFVCIAPRQWKLFLLDDSIPWCLRYSNPAHKINWPNLQQSPKEDLVKSIAETIAANRSKRIFELCKRFFSPGEEIPLVEFMYKPDDASIIKECGYSDGLRYIVDRDFSVGDKFPEPTTDQEMILVYPGHVYFLYTAPMMDSDSAYGWEVVCGRDNVPVALHYLSGK